MVAATIRKMQAKNQLAAVLDVSGSPLLNLPYVLIPADQTEYGSNGITQFGGRIEIRSHKAGSLIDAGKTLSLCEGTCPLPAHTILKIGFFSSLSNHFWV